jgi:hypothetical protein
LCFVLFYQSGVVNSNNLFHIELNTWKNEEGMAFLAEDERVVFCKTLVSLSLNLYYKQGDTKTLSIKISQYNT